MIRLLIIVAALMSVTLAPSAALAREGLLARALSCRIDAGEVATLMDALAANDAGMKSAAQSFGAPSGDLYRLTAPVSALGYSTDAIYVSPGRILMVVSGQDPALVSARLKLTHDPHGPAARRIDGERQIVVYQLHQGDLDGKVLVGCEYGDPAALTWLAEDAAGF